MNYDCKVYQYSDHAERWRGCATFADRETADGDPIVASDAADAAQEAVRKAVRRDRLDLSFDPPKMQVRVVVTHEDVVTVYDVPLTIAVGNAEEVDSEARAKMLDPLRRNEP